MWPGSERQGGGGGGRGGAAAGGRRGAAGTMSRRRQNQLRQQRWRTEQAGLEDGEDVLASYYKSKLPDEHLALAPPHDDGHSDHAVQPDGSTHLTQQQKGTATLRADKLIEAAVQRLETQTRTPHLLIRATDILWLHAGGNTEAVLRLKCEQFGQLLRLKVFPRQSFACASFADPRSAASAQIALDNHTVYCRPFTVTFLQRFLSREAILAAQHDHLPAGEGAAAAVVATTAATNELERALQQRGGSTGTVGGQQQQQSASPPDEEAAEPGEGISDEVEQYLRFLLGE